VRNLLFLVTAGVLASSACTPPPTPVDATSRIYFRAPLDNAVVPPTFDVVFGLRDYGVAPAGVELPNTGHFHILIDVEPPAPGEMIPTDSLHRHFGGGQIETRLTLAPGSYTLRLVLADHLHRVIGPELVSEPVRVTVRAP
jgi:hypothetical protein